MIIGIDASRSLRSHKTGTEWYSYHVIAGLAGVDSVNDYVLYTDSPIPAAERELLPNNFTYRRLKWFSKSFWTQGRLSWEMMRRPSDVLFVPSHVIPGVHPQRTVNTIHDVGFLEYPEGYSERQLQYLKWSTKLAVASCKRLITVSQFTKNELVRLFNADPAKIFVTPLGYDRDRYTPKGDEDMAVLERHTISRPYIFYAGRLEPRKNIETLLKAFELVRNEGIEIDLVLTGPLGYKGEALVHLIKKHSYFSNIHYLGWVSEEDKIALLRQSFSLVFPSFYEGFGLPVIEAQACGVPVICSNSSALPEVGGDGALYFDPRDAAQAAGYIVTLWNDSGRRERLIEKGFGNAQGFDWKKTAIETKKILTEW